MSGKMENPLDSDLADGESETFRDRIAEAPPKYFCEECRSVVYDEFQTCRSCGRERPEAGWELLTLAADPWLGRKVNDRYLVTKRVGTGTTSAVYRAESLAIPRTFAIKILDLQRQGEGIDAEQMKIRLKREIEALSCLRNPHVVSFYETFEIGKNHIAFVMDFIDGVTLSELVRREGSLSAERAVSMVRQIANAVSEAHSTGLIHRDLKPENIMVETLASGDDFARILDFGVVWIRGQAHMTRGFIGTPLFASPEQATGSELDERADIYSLGAILFYVLTGRPPFNYDSVMRILDAHVTEKPPRLAAVLGKPVPNELEDLTAELLAKRPDDRPSQLTDVIERLDELTPKTLAFESSVSLETTGSAQVTVDRGFDRANRPPSLVLETTVAAPGPGGIAVCSQSHAAYLDMEGRIVVVSLGDESPSFYPIDTDAPIEALALDGATPMVGLSNGRVLRLNQTEFQEVCRSADGAPITDISCASTGCMAASTESGDVYVRTCGVGSGEWELFGSFDAAVVAIALNSEGDQLAIAVRSDGLLVFDITNSSMPVQSTTEEVPVRSMSFSNDGHLLAILNAHGDLRLQSAVTGKPVMTASEFSPSLRGISFSAENQLQGIQHRRDRVAVVNLQKELSGE